MSEALVLFNGIQFHDYHVDRATNWAISHKSAIRGIFVHSDKEPDEGYVYPSDIDPAEDLYGKNEAAKSNLQVIASQVKLFTNMVKAKRIPVNTEEFVNPPLETITAKTGPANIMFLDAEYSRAYLLACTSFTIEEVIEKSKCPVELVPHDR